LRERAKQAAMLVRAPHNLKECVRGCTFFIEHWELSEACRNAVTSVDVLHALMRNIRQCDRSAKQVPLLTAAYDLLQLVANDVAYASTLAESRDCLNIVVEHMQMFRDRPSLLESTVRVVLALCENSNAHVGRKMVDRIESLMEIIRSNRTVHRRRAMSFAHQGRHDAEVEARDALLQSEQCLAALKKLNVLCD
jgi:abnormal spindle-like microcephaly-associated protein